MIMVASIHLSDNFIQEFKDKQPNWGPLGYITYKRCVSIDTPILTKDLRWIPAGDIPVGTEILAFDEEKQLGSKHRNLQVATITHNSKEEADCLEIELSNGELLWSTPDHSWLVKKASNKLVWTEAQNLLQGRTEKCYMLRYFDVWEEDLSYEGGFLAAAFDGEGCLDKHRGLQFVQVQNPMLDKVLKYLDKFRFQYKITEKQKTSKTSQQCYSVRITGHDQVARFLGMFRPPRLLQKYLSLDDPMQLKRQKFRHKEDIYVKSLTPVKREVAVISTTTKTHFTGGYPSHNTYARPVKDENRTEEWWETCRRVVEGTYSIQKSHCQQLTLPWNAHKAQRSAQEMFRLMWDFKFLPPGRGLWMMGTEFVSSKGGAALNNCAFVSTRNLSTDFAEPFTFLMDMSMLGVGVGGDTKGEGTVKIKPPRQGEFTFTVEDTREGWVELLRTTLNAYAGKGSLPNKIDYSNVRVYGEPIKGFGGTASGPDPLKELIEKNIPEILDPIAEEEGNITGTAIVDIFNAIGKCVVSGNVRRSAEIMLGDPTDQQFLELKDPKKNKRLLKKWRWASNNSVFAEVGMDYKDVAERTAKNGEPGYFWLDTTRKYGRLCDPPDHADMLVEGTNPCSEQSLESYELCCLVETFPARHESLEEYQRTLKFAYLYAKTVTLVKTHNERTNAVMLRNRRIGTSQSGIAQSFSRHGIRKHFHWCDEGYKYLRDMDRKYSRWLCIPQSIKITSVKPSGTVSLLPGATPGVHFPYGEYYWRVIRFDGSSDLIKTLRTSGYKIVDLADEGQNTVGVYFPVKEENFYKSRKEISIWEQLEITAQMQYYWADNQVSVTITFKEEEASQIKQALEFYETRLKSVSFLPLEEHGFKHAPYQIMTKEEYDKTIKLLKPIKLNNFTETEGFENKYCDNDTCTLP